ncbi:MAG: type II toxin-antitoxin system HicA family toxin [Cyclobacteriaceae bacterium]|jgi:predicted RNA binding protein YcfA (HicA-like mRNA interferase family)
MTPKELIKILEGRGFVLKRVKGSHHIFQNPISGKITVVPVHKGDLPKGTFRAILKQAGISLED